MGEIVHLRYVLKCREARQASPVPAAAFDCVFQDAKGRTQIIVTVAKAADAHMVFNKVASYARQNGINVSLHPLYQIVGKQGLSGDTVTTITAGAAPALVEELAERFKTRMLKEEFDFISTPAGQQVRAKLGVPVSAGEIATLRTQLVDRFGGVLAL